MLINYLYASDGTRVGFKTGGNVYYYVYNLQGDVTHIVDESRNIAATYRYDPFGKILNLSSLTNIGKLNPFRYRGYYYDTESNLYYLTSRYYNPEIGRFINADGQLSTGQDVLGTNLYAYCANNPVFRTDAGGNKWYHWALGGAIVVGCAVATVLTCGGFAAAAGAVAAVASGSVALTTASTVAAGAFIGSAVAYGSCVISASVSSKSVKEFNKKGNWKTVAATAGGAVLGGGSAYISTKARPYVSRGSTGRTEPKNLREQLAMEQVKSNPLNGDKLYNISLNDSRWPASDGWIKMQQIVPTSQGDISIHYVYNTDLVIFDDFKFK